MTTAGKLYRIILEDRRQGGASIRIRMGGWVISGGRVYRVEGRWMMRWGVEQERGGRGRRARGEVEGNDIEMHVLMGIGV